MAGDNTGLRAYATLSEYPLPQGTAFGRLATVYTQYKPFYGGGDWKGKGAPGVRSLPL